MHRARWALSATETKYLCDANNMSNEQLTPIANKLIISVEELRKYGDNIIPIKASSYEDFKNQYDGLWNYQSNREKEVLSHNPEKMLKTKVNSDIINLNNSELSSAYTKVKVEDIPPMNETTFNIASTNLKKKGIAIIRDSDGDAYLKGMNAEAMTLSDGSAIIFQSGRIPSASAFFEEVIHTTQIRNKGMLNSIGDNKSTLEYLSREIEANEKLLKHKEAYKLTEKDIESVEEKLNMYYKQLERVKRSV